ncbi:MAG: hypothetical protein QM528_06735 [Phycisphaerales bacterium]|nr:hypothetical protein [Phycisphaerales bacterium]
MKQKQTSLGVFMSRQEVKKHEMKKVTGGSCKVCFSIFYLLCKGNCDAGIGCPCYYECCIP